ncbi:MAG: MFS transporter [Deltaproteobacteria bacterium]|nr:MFS transporter [Deltaproteobacteria bacterium]
MKRTPLSAVFMTVVVDLIGFGIVIPLLPLYAQQFGASGLQVGLLMTSYSAAQLVAAPLWGRLSDRVGRRPVLLVSLCGSTVSYAIAALAGSLWLLFLARLLGGISGGNLSAAQAYVADVTAPEERARGMGLLGAAFGIGFVIGPAIGGALVGFGPWVPFAGAALLCGGNFVWTWISLPEPPRPHAGDPRAAARRGLGWKELLVAVRQPRLLSLLVLFFCATFALANLEATFALSTHRLFGYGNRENAFLFTYIGLMLAVTQAVRVGRLAKRLGEPALVVLGLLVTVGGLFAVPYAHNLWHLLAILALFSFGSGISSPSISSLISRAAGAGVQGGVLGAGQSAASLARVVGPACGGFCFDRFGVPAPYLLGATVMIVAWTISLTLLRPPLPEPPPRS